QQFDRVKPKYALVGLSVFEGNIDEITNAVAKKRGIRAGVIQDYWGYLGNFKEGNMPDDIFVIDTLAHELTGKKIEDRSKIIITGSPKHVMYNPEICKQEKKAILKNAILKNEPKEIVYFGQPYAMPGIYDNLRYFVQALNGISQPIRVRLKIHPLDKGREEEYVALFKTQPHPFQLIPVEKRAESCLLEADLVVTCFSTVGLDHNYLQSQST
ncbi:MAG: hypothetical protein GY757_39810, partial [bacterium]|nr:hypothetical protein [bacterium]